MIKDLIAKGQTEKALQQLLLYVQFNRELEDEVLDTLSNYKRLQRESMAGRTSTSKFNSESSKVNAVILSFLNHLEEKHAGIFSNKNVKISAESFREQLEMKIADKYVLERCLGEGSSAIFYKAREHDTERFVALRAMKKQDFTQSLLEKEKPDFSKIYQIKHRNIIKIIGVSLGHFPECIMLEYISGIALSRILKSGGRPIREVISTTSMIADALYYLHTKGILHNKIRPSKILMDEEQQPMISPFEIMSRQHGGDSKFAKFKEELRYSSPEEVQGGELSGKSDQFSFGLLVYEMLKGHPLFDGDNIEVIFEQRKRFFTDKKYRDQKIKELGVPSKFGYILHRLLNEVPSGRYPNLREVMNQLALVKIKIDDNRKNALESYHRCCAANVRFTEDFYALLFEKHPELEAYFQFNEKKDALVRRNKTRKRMLRSAINLLLESDQENNYLHKLSKMKSHQGLSEAAFKQFVEVIILTASKSDRLWNEKIKTCWETVTSENLQIMIN